jgi:hypothetical protein
MQLQVKEIRSVEVFPEPEPNTKPVILSDVSYSSSDAAVFEVTSEPAKSNVAVMRGTGSGSATLKAKGTATAEDKTTIEFEAVLPVTVIAAPTVGVAGKTKISFRFDGEATDETGNQPQAWWPKKWQQQHRAANPEPQPNPTPEL